MSQDHNDDCNLATGCHGLGRVKGKVDMLVGASFAAGGAALELTEQQIDGLFIAGAQL